MTFQKETSLPKTISDVVITTMRLVVFATCNVASCCSESPQLDEDYSIAAETLAPIPNPIHKPQHNLQTQTQSSRQHTE
jgi:hypothetical protein